MPLGTGNDLARSFGWGKGFAAKMGKESWLQNVGSAHPEKLDRWSVTLDWCDGLPSQFGRPEGDRPEGDGAGNSLGGEAVQDGGVRMETSKLRRGIMCNYFGLGIEAAGLHAFHEAREAAPHKFKSRLLNQAKMGMLGVPNSGLLHPCCGRQAPQLAQVLRLWVRKPISPEEWKEVPLPRHLKAIILLNIDSHAAGRHMWKPAPTCFAQNPADGQIEVCGLASASHFGLYLGCGYGRLRASGGIKLEQATAVKFELLSELHVHVDGEPWIQTPGVISIEHAGQSSLLRFPPSRAPATSER